MCIDLVEIWFEIANGQISSIFDRVICMSYVPFFLFCMIAWSKYQWIFTKVGICIDIFIKINIKIWFGIANGQSSSIFDSYLPATHMYFCFQIIALININGFSPNLM